MAAGDRAEHQAVGRDIHKLPSCAVVRKEGGGGGSCPKGFGWWLRHSLSRKQLLPHPDAPAAEAESTTPQVGAHGALPSDLMPA